MGYSLTYLITSVSTETLDYNIMFEFCFPISMALLQINKTTRGLQAAQTAADWAFYFLMMICILMAMFLYTAIAFNSDEGKLSFFELFFLPLLQLIAIVISCVSAIIPSNMPYCTLLFHISFHV